VGPGPPLVDRRLVVVTGKGGVGRSALAAALAIRAARRGRRVLAMAMTDGAGLAAHLRVDALDYRPRTVRTGLDALAIDPAAGLDEYLRLQLHLPRIGPMTRAFHVLADTVPGIRDTVVIGKAIYEAAGGDWDLVVADGPPIGQVMSYVRAPATIQSLVPAGRVERQASWMREVLEDPAHTGLVMVTLAEELPVSETLEALDALRSEAPISRAELVVNRLIPDLDTAPGVLEAAPPGPAGDAARLHCRLRAAQQEWLERLPEATRLPYLFGVFTPGEVSARLADLWEAS
jgi:anion-transporting  ArsA/GET3 family ATPase